MIKLSIIIPHYNRERKLLRCLDSIADNDYDKNIYEVLVVDDCSPSSIVAAESYARFPNYRFIRRAANSGGASAPRNDGVREAVGEFLLFVDSDDAISGGALSAMMNMAEGNGLDTVVLKKKTVRGNGAYFADMTDDVSFLAVDADDLSEAGIKADVLVFMDSFCVGKLFRADIIKRYGMTFPEDMVIGEDACFNKVYWLVSERAGLISSEIYDLEDVGDDHLDGASDAEFWYKHASNIMRAGFSIPDEATPLAKKARVLNAICHKEGVIGLLGDKYYAGLLKRDFLWCFERVRDYFGRYYVLKEFYGILGVI